MVEILPLSQKGLLFGVEFHYGGECLSGQPLTLPILIHKFYLSSYQFDFSVLTLDGYTEADGILPILRVELHLKLILLPAVHHLGEP